MLRRVLRRVVGKYVDVLRKQPEGYDVTKLALTLTCTVLAAGCSRSTHGDEPPFSPTTALQANGPQATRFVPQREVGDIGGGGGVCPPQDAIFCEQRYRVVATNGAIVSGTCMPTNCTVLQATGRFAGAIAVNELATTPNGMIVGFGFKVPDPAVSVDASLLLRLPQLGGNVFWMSGTLNAQRQDSADSVCPSGIRTTLDLSGKLEGIGNSTGTLSYCAR